MLKLRIALRYLLSRKQFGAVNVISAISVAAVAVAAAAMIIVLSVFNGFERLAESKLSAIDPDYLAVPAEGKHIAGVDSIVSAIGKLPGVKAVAPQIAEKAYARSGNNRMAVSLLAMTPHALKESGLAAATVDGTCRFLSDTSAIVSAGVALTLGVRPYESLDTIDVYEPRRTGAINPANPMAAFQTARLHVVGVFQVEQEEYDRDVMVIPYALGAKLLNYNDMATSIAIYTANGFNDSPLRKLTASAGLQIKNRHEQQQQTFRMIAIEKWISFLMLGFILVVASANIISTLSMLVIEKEPNMAILKAMGATRRFVRGIFITQGWLIVALGGLAGVIIGILLVLGQMHFGWIKLGTSNPELMSIDIYPVVLKWPDVAFSLAAVLAVALLLTPVVAMVVKRR